MKYLATEMKAFESQLFSEEFLLSIRSRICNIFLSFRERGFELSDEFIGSTEVVAHYGGSYITISNKCLSDLLDQMETRSGHTVNNINEAEDFMDTQDAPAVKQAKPRTTPPEVAERRLGLGKKICIIGIGNCGNQIAALAEKRYPQLADCVYINTSNSDLSQVKNDSNLKYRIGEGVLEGTGKNRAKMKDALQVDIKKILGDSKFQSTIANKKYILVISSAAGGTGSGSAPVFAEILMNATVGPNIILVGILPSLNESEMELGNALEFLDELYNDTSENLTYMLYDNDNATGMSPTEALVAVNDAVVEDIRILSGIDNHPTPYKSMDDADMEAVSTVPGRLIICRINKGLTEKYLEDNDIGDIIIQALKKSYQAETNRDGKVFRWGINTYFTDRVYKLVKMNLDKLCTFLGTPAERFDHNAVNEGHESANFIYLMAAGMGPITDKVGRMNDRIEYLREVKSGVRNSEFKIEETSASYAAMEDLKNARNIQIIGKKAVTDSDLANIFNKFRKQN
jgi:cell division GTPase FtsZ